ncbi:cyanobacterial phytochrome A [Nostoc sp. T09]|uniref:ATP-binding protein n=1 Tax=Nostoc sp. T09 TaxID=1932621 RepID=UPI000A39C5B5|nr:ATP-binding protein [Nostoc sp. T09]OUL35923.1 cyanobacterial phytochrome A [Nostoc sp. T09]
MSQSEDKTAQTASLTNHDRKPIHIPGSIQPHGVLLALSPQLDILQVSDNTLDYLGRTTQELLGQPLNTLLAQEQVAAIRQCWSKKVDSVTSYKVSIITLNQERYFDCIVHRTEDVVILELEPIHSRDEVSFLSFYTLVNEAIAQMQKTSNLTEFLHLVATELREITAFDRVMVYQFDRNAAGSVVAEAKREDLPPYLGLHYPATDIPAQARDLYTRSLLRFIPNLTAQPVKLVPIENPITHQPLDLSLSVLRSVDSCCIEYHQNMGVAALLVISLIQEQQLWGLISCHHHTPKHISYELRQICEFLGRIVSSELTHKVNQLELDYKVKLKSLQSEFIESISQADNFIDALIKPELRLLDVVSASGAAVCLDNEITLVGATPDIEQVRALIEWADTQVKDNLFSTNSLPQLYPDGIAFKDTVSGLLLLRISQVRRYYILWFRPEVIQTVNWAGNPNEFIHLADDTLTLNPRKSFAKWQETVRLTSLPWKPCELDSAIALRNAIVGIVLSKADELAKINLDLERSNRELASFAYAASHDLKEPLRGIYNYSTILLEDYGLVLDDDGIECLETVVTLSVRMETLINALLRLAQLGKAQLRKRAIDFNELLNQLIDVFRASRQDSQLLDIRIPRPLATVQCDSVLVNEVFSNLIGNAFKYNDKAEQWVEIGYLDPDEQQTKEQTPVPPLFYVRDNGIGIPEHHRETIFRLFKRLHSQEKYGGGVGAGLAIVKKIVELHNGRIWVESTVGIGSTFYFTLE